MADEDYAWNQVQQQARAEVPAIIALSRNRFSAEPPKGRQLEEIKSQMLRIHRASGHASTANLQRLLSSRKAPQWAIIDLAGASEIALSPSSLQVLQLPLCMKRQVCLKSLAQTFLSLKVKAVTSSTFRSSETVQVAW